MTVLSVRPRVAVKNILVTTDFSPESELALRYATVIARSYGSKMHLVHAVHTAEHALYEGVEAEAEAEEKLRALARECRDIECSEWVLKGDDLEVVERILSFGDIDLVIAGTHKARRFHKMATSSAAEHFFRHVCCPVLAIGASVAECPAVWDPKRVLLATDLQSDETAASRCAVFLAREHDARLALLYVAPPSPAPYPEDQQVIARPYFESRLRELLAYKAGLSYPAEYWVEFGEDAVREIVRVVREKKMELVVLSVHREEPWGFHFVHQAYRIVAEAPCPVLITQRRF